MATDARPRSPGVVLLSIALALIAVLAALALTARQPPPPTIAEFAPQAAEQIVDAPDDQSSTSGRDGGACVGDDCPGGASPGVTPEPIRLPQVRKCVGDPPRQIEDPQSPPCIPYWTGDNGGATSRGVTRDQINISFARPRGEDWSRWLHALSSFFNRRFEFYGRKLHFQPYIATRDPSGAAVGMEADGVKVAEEHKAFAAQGYEDRANQEMVHYDALAKRGVISIAQRPAMWDADHMQAHHPYQWSYLPGTDIAGRQLADWTCKTLKGGTAEWAGGAEMTKPRAFGLWRHYTTDGSRPDDRPLLQGLRACGIELRDRVDVQDPNGAADRYNNAILKLRDSGVTTIICLCRQAALLWSAAPASGSGYFPEWVVSTWEYGDDDHLQHLRDGEQPRHTFGLTFWSKRGPLRETPCDIAAREIDPTIEWPSHNNGLDGGYLWCYNLYEPMLLLASGIQQAGPRLTPETFAAGLFKTNFPNPQAGRAPHYQAHVAFGVGDHTMNDDAAAVWYNAVQPSPQMDGNAPGTFCYYDHGTRYALGSWPAGRQALFTGDCT